MNASTPHTVRACYDTTMPYVVPVAEGNGGKRLRRQSAQAGPEKHCMSASRRVRFVLKESLIGQAQTYYKCSLVIPYFAEVGSGNFVFHHFQDNVLFPTAADWPFL